LEQLEGEEIMTDFHIWVNCHFKSRRIESFGVDSPSLGCIPHCRVGGGAVSILKRGWGCG